MLSGLGPGIVPGSASALSHMQCKVQFPVRPRSGRGVSYTPVLNQVQFLRARSDFRSRSEVVFKTGSVLGSTLDRGVNNAGVFTW